MFATASPTPASPPLPSPTPSLPPSHPVGLAPVIGWEGRGFNPSGPFLVSPATRYSIDRLQAMPVHRFPFGWHRGWMCQPVPGHRLEAPWPRIPCLGVIICSVSPKVVWWLSTVPGQRWLVPNPVLRRMVVVSGVHNYYSPQYLPAFGPAANRSYVHPGTAR